MMKEFQEALARYYGITSHSFDLQKKLWEQVDVLSDVKDQEARQRCLREGIPQFLKGKTSAFQI